MIRLRQAARSTRLRILSTVLALWPLAFSASSIAQASNNPLTQELQSRYSAMKAAMAAHDGAAIAELLAPDFVSIDVSGQLETASQMITEVSSLASDPNRSSKTTFLSIDRAGKMITVKQQYDMKTVRTDQNGRHNIELVTLSTDTWVDGGGTWLIKRTVTDEMSLFVDGRLIEHKLHQ